MILHKLSELQKERDLMEVDIMELAKTLAKVKTDEETENLVLEAENEIQSIL